MAIYALRSTASLEVLSIVEYDGSSSYDYLSVLGLELYSGSMIEEFTAQEHTPYDLYDPIHGLHITSEVGSVLKGFNYMSGSLSLIGDVFSTGSQYLEGELNVAGELNALGSITVSGSLNISGSIFVDGDKLEEVFAIAPKTCGKLKYSETKLEDRNQNPTFGFLPSAPFFEFDVETSINGQSGDNQWKVSRPTQVIIPRRAIGSTSEQIDYEGKLFAILENRLAWSRITFSQENSDPLNQAFTSAFKEFEIITMRYIEKRWDPILQSERYYEKNWGDKDFSETPATQIWTNHPSTTFLDRQGYFIITVNQVRPTTLANYSNPPINGDLFSVCIAIKEYRKSITVISGSQKYMVPWWADKTTIIAVAPGGGGGGGAWGYPHSEDIHSLYDYSVASPRSRQINVTYPCISADDHNSYGDGSIFEKIIDSDNIWNEYKNLPNSTEINKTGNRHFNLRKSSWAGGGSPRLGPVDYTEMQNNYDNLIGHEYVTGGSGGSGGTVVISEFDKYKLPQGTILDVYIGSPGKGGSGVDANDDIVVLDRDISANQEQYILFNSFQPTAISLELQNPIVDFPIDYYEDGYIKEFVNYGGYSFTTKYGDPDTCYSFAFIKDGFHRNNYEWRVLRPDIESWVNRVDWEINKRPGDAIKGIPSIYSSYLGSFKNLIIGSGFKLAYIRERGGYKTRIRQKTMGFEYYDPYVSWWEININPFSLNDFITTDLFDDFDPRTVLQIDEELETCYCASSWDSFTWFSYGWENNKKIEQSNSRAKYHGKNGGDVFVVDPFGKEILRAKGGVGGSAGYGTRAFYDDFFRFSWNKVQHIVDTGVNNGDPKTYVIPGTPNTNGSKGDIIRPGGLGGYGVHMPIGRNLSTWLQNGSLDLSYGFTSQFSTAPNIPSTSAFSYTDVANVPIPKKHNEAIPSDVEIESAYMTGTYTAYDKDGTVVYPKTPQHQWYRPGDGVYDPDAEKRWPTELAPPGGGGGSGASWQGLDLRSFPRNGSAAGVASSKTNEFIPYYSDSKLVESLLKRQVESINSHVKLGLGGQLIPTTNGFTDTFLVNDFDSDGVLHQVRLERGGNGGYGTYYGQNTFSTQTWPQNLQDNFNNLSNTLPEDVSSRWGVGGGGGAAEYLKTHSDRNNLGQPGIPIKGQDGADGGPGVVIIIAEKNSL